MTNDKCKVSIKSSWHSHHECGKTAKGRLKDGTPACGIHLSAERRRNENLERWRKEIDEGVEWGKEIVTLAGSRGLNVSYDSQKRTITMEEQTFRKLVESYSKEEK